MQFSELERKSITFSNGQTIVLSHSNWRISRKLDNMEREAEQNPLPEPDDQMFALNFYPKMAAPVVSDNCPTLETALATMSSEDLELWYVGAREINPQWFKTLDQLGDMALQQAMETGGTSDKEILKEQQTLSA